MKRQTNTAGKTNRVYAYGCGQQLLPEPFWSWFFMGVLPAGSAIPGLWTTHTPEWALPRTYAWKLGTRWGITCALNGYVFQA